MASEPTLRELALSALDAAYFFGQAEHAPGYTRSDEERAYDRRGETAGLLLDRIDALEAAPVHYAAHPCADAAEPWTELIEDTTCVACLRGECERLAAALAAAESEPTGLVKASLEDIVYWVDSLYEDTAYPGIRKLKQELQPHAATIKAIAQSADTALKALTPQPDTATESAVFHAGVAVADAYTNKAPQAARAFAVVSLQEAVGAWRAGQPDAQEGQP